MNTEDWPIPTDLSDDGRKAAEAILTFLTEKGLTYHGGGGRFYSPQEWTDRGEDYGTESLLVITHDGGDHAGAFNHDYEQYELIDQLRDRLLPLGVFAESCTSWYSAVYPI